MGIKISELPQGTANVEAVVPATNAAGTLTEKINLGDIANLRQEWEEATFVANSFTATAGHKYYLEPTDAVVAEDFEVVDPPSSLNGEWYSFWNQSIQVVTVGGVRVPAGHSVTRYCEQGGPGPGTWKTAPTPGQSFPIVVSLPFATTLNTNALAGGIFDVTLTDNITLANPSNPVNGQTLRWRLTQDSTGNRSVTLGSQFNLPASATSPLPFSTTAGKTDVLAATYHAGREKWDVVAFVPGY